MYVNGDNHINFVNGCVLVLVVCYCYRFPLQGRPYPRTLPLVQHLSEKFLKTRFEAGRASGFVKAIIALEGLPITHQYNDWCKGIAQGVVDAEGVNPLVEEMPLADRVVEINEQEETVQETPINELILTRLLSYQLNERWETDEEIRRKAIDVSVLSFLLLYISYIFKVQIDIKYLVIGIRYHITRH